MLLAPTLLRCCPDVAQPLRARGARRSSPATVEVYAKKSCSPLPAADRGPARPRRAGSPTGSNQRWALSDSCAACRLPDPSSCIQCTTVSPHMRTADTQPLAATHALKLCLTPRCAPGQTCRVGAVGQWPPARRITPHPCNSHPTELTMRLLTCVRALLATVLPLLSPPAEQASSVPNRESGNMRPRFFLYRALPRPASQ